MSFFQPFWAVNAFILLFFSILIHQCDNELIWSDEFNGESLDLTKWSYYTGPQANHELQKYTNRSANVFLKNGSLVLQALKEKYDGFNYTSGRIYTKGKADFLYTHVEVRAKLPFGRGLWPAIWMLPTYYKHGPGIASGELDIMELLGQNPNKIYSTAHYGHNWTDRGHKSNNYTLPSKKFSDDFHIFGIRWTPNEVNFFVDQVQILNVSHADIPKKYSYPFDDYFYIILNVAVGGDWPGPPDNSTVFPQKMEVDYVRVYN